MEQKQIAVEQTQVAVEQKRVAVENYQLSREQSFQIIDLIESSEAQIAAVPSLHKTRKEILVLVSNACRRYLDQEPEDAELRRRSAQVFRYTANVHRLTDEIDAADPLYRDALQLYEGLVKQFPDETRFRQTLADTGRDYASLKARIGHLKAATETLEQSLGILETLCTEHADQVHLRQSLAATLVSLGSVQYSRGMYDESSKSAGRAATIYRELAEIPGSDKRPYDPVMLAAALNLVAICEREAGRLEAAYEAHKEPLKILFEIVNQPPAGVNPFDAKHFYASCQLEQFRTWAKFPIPKRLENAEKGFGATITLWEALAKSLPHVPMYRGSLGVAYEYRARIRVADPARVTEARDDLEKSRTLLMQRVQDTPNVPAPRGDLGRTYLALGRLAKQANDPAAADWFGKAAESLEEAVKQSPDNAQEKQSLEELRSQDLK